MDYGRTEGGAVECGKRKLSLWGIPNSVEFCFRRTEVARSTEWSYVRPGRIDVSNSLETGRKEYLAHCSVAT